MFQQNLGRVSDTLDGSPHLHPRALRAYGIVCSCSAARTIHASLPAITLYRSRLHEWESLSVPSDPLCDRTSLVIIPPTRLRNPYFEPHAVPQYFTSTQYRALPGLSGHTLGG